MNAPRPPPSCCRRRSAAGEGFPLRPPLRQPSPAGAVECRTPPRGGRSPASSPAAAGPPRPSRRPAPPRAERGAACLPACAPGSPAPAEEVTWAHHYPVNHPVVTCQGWERRKRERGGKKPARSSCGGVVLPGLPGTAAAAAADRDLLPSLVSRWLLRYSPGTACPWIFLLSRPRSPLHIGHLCFVGDVEVAASGTDPRFAFRSSLAAGPLLVLFNLFFFLSCFYAI